MNQMKVIDSKTRLINNAGDNFLNNKKGIKCTLVLKNKELIQDQVSRAVSAALGPLQEQIINAGLDHKKVIDGLQTKLDKDINATETRINALIANDEVNKKVKIDFARQFYEASVNGSSLPQLVTNLSSLELPSIVTGPAMESSTSSENINVLSIKKTEGTTVPAGLKSKLIAELRNIYSEYKLDTETQLKKQRDEQKSKYANFKSNVDAAVKSLTVAISESQLMKMSGGSLPTLPAEEAIIPTNVVKKEEIDVSENILQRALKEIELLNLQDIEPSSEALDSILMNLQNEEAKIKLGKNESTMWKDAAQALKKNQKSYDVEINRMKDQLNDNNKLLNDESVKVKESVTTHNTTLEQEFQSYLSYLKNYITNLNSTIEANLTSKNKKIQDKLDAFFKEVRLLQQKRNQNIDEATQESKNRKMALETERATTKKSLNSTHATEKKKKDDAYQASSKQLTAKKTAVENYTNPIEITGEAQLANHYEGSWAPGGGGAYKAVNVTQVKRQKGKLGVGGSSVFVLNNGNTVAFNASCDINGNVGGGDTEPNYVPLVYQL